MAPGSLRTDAVLKATQFGRVAKGALFSALLSGAVAIDGGFDLQRRFLKRTHPGLRGSLVQWVHTREIERWTMPDRWPVPYSGEFIVNNDWDLEYVGDLEYYRENSRNYRSVWQVFSEGRPYGESDQYRFLAEVIGEGGWHPEVSERGRNMEEVDRYFAELGRVFEAMKESGFRSQSELGTNEPFPDEIRVMVDRNGRLVRAFGGNHRFAMAQILGIPRIPIFVLAVHSLWAKRWFEAVAGGIVGALQHGLASLACTGANEDE